MLMSLEETIEMGLEGVVHFRTRTAEEYPQDRRNGDAVAIADQLLKSPHHITPETQQRFDALESEIDTMIDADEDIESELHQLSEAESEIFRCVGFRSEPAAYEDIAVELCEAREKLLASVRAERV